MAKKQTNKKRYNSVNILKDTKVQKGNVVAVQL